MLGLFRARLYLKKVSKISVAEVCLEEYYRNCFNETPIQVKLNDLLTTSNFLLNLNLLDVAVY